MQSNETEAPVLVIGYGNTLRGDDGAGPAAAEALRDRLPARLAEVVAVHQLLPELTEPLSRSSLAIFIDADWQTSPGKVHKKTLKPNHEESKTIGHHQSPENLLNMARELYGHAPPALLFQVGAVDFGYQEGLSEPVRRAISKLIKEVVQTVEKAAAKAKPDAQKRERHHA
jgi:hydrogenase maturation protease